MDSLVDLERAEHHNRPARRTTLAIRAEEAFSPDEHAIDMYAAARWRARNDRPTPDDPWSDVA
jgi:hypothetical protein